MTADVSINDDSLHKPDYQNSPLGKRYCECQDQVKDVRKLAQDCMCHQCNKFCLQSSKIKAPRTCRIHYGTESAFGKMDTQGLPCIPKSKTVTDIKGISHFQMTRTQYVRVVQHSRILLRSWRANCDIKLLLCYLDPSCPDIRKIEDVVGMLWPTQDSGTTQHNLKKLLFKTSF
jgi:hypothetical protein